MKELKYPKATMQVMCSNLRDVYHFVTVEPNQVCTSGQPVMEVFATKELLATKVATCAMTIKNQEDYEKFMSPDVIEKPKEEAKVQNES